MIDVIQHGTENDVYADYSTARWRVGLYPPYTYRPYTTQEAAAIRYGWKHITVVEEHVLAKVAFHVTLSVAAFMIGISVIYCIDPWIIKLFIDEVYFRDWAFMNDAIGRFTDDFWMIFFLWILGCLVAGWIVTHLLVSKKPTQ